MILLILVVGVLNLAVGFAAAMALGYGPPGWSEAWWALTAEPVPAAWPLETPAADDGGAPAASTPADDGATA